MRFLKRTKILFRFGNNLQPILRYIMDNGRCAVVELLVLTSSVDTAFLTQPIPISSLLQRIADGRLLLPNVEGLRTIEGVRTTDQLSKLELSTLMINTNRLSGVLGHLQGVIEDLWSVQTQEYAHRLTIEGSGSLEVVATQVAERALDAEFGDLSLSRVNSELEDFGNNVGQEGSE